MLIRACFVLNCFFILRLLGASLAYECKKTIVSEIQNHLGTKTPYRVISNKSDTELKFQGCNPIRIWSIIRHGTRNPSRNDIFRCKEDLTLLREKILSSQNSKLCSYELSLFRNWNCNLNKDEAKYLVHEGEEELIELSERMQNRFPKLLIDQYDVNYYKFKYTASQRTKKSAHNFAIGLFGRHNIKQIIYKSPLKKDPILRFYKLCDRWKYGVKKNPNTHSEAEKFLLSNEMKNLIKSISRKTGVNGFSADDVMLIYKFCAFETAWNKRRISPWCTLFDETTIQIPEFVEDLKYYWIDGYGYELTYKQACPAIKDLMNHIRPDSHEANATFYFTHSGTILKFLAHLGLYKDDVVLKHTDYKKKRKWRVSHIDSFASNIAFVTYKCSDKYKVLILHQENIVRLPGCGANDLCSFKKFEKLFEESTTNCKFDEICEI